MDPLIWNRQKPKEPVEDTRTVNSASVDTAWRIHGALVDWTGKVDAKATFAFTIQSAGVVSTVALSGPKRVFDAMEGPWQHVLYYGGILALLFAAAFSVWVVVPRLRMRHVKKEYKDNFIYFGHLQYWDPADLPEAIARKDILPVLAQQMVKMSEIVWHKHIAVKVSMVFAIAGGVSLVACGFMVRFGITP